MNREIKFRVWDKVNEKMSMVYHYNFSKQLISIDEGDNTLTDEVGIFIPMQYTGLKDKNGVEIYESDIVQDTLGSKKKGVIEYHPWEFGVQTDNRFVGNRYVNTNEHIEVIGNIYENPELLKSGD